MKKYLMAILFGMAILAMLYSKRNLVKDRTLNLIVTTEEVTLDPTKAKGYQQFQILDLFLDTLVGRDPELGYVSWLATKWEISKSGTEYVFTIDKNSRFHDGTLVTPIDVAEAFESHMREGSASILSTYLKNVLKSVEPLGEMQVKFTLQGPYPAFIDLLSMPGFGIYKFNNDHSAILGTGPFRFADFKNGVWCFERELQHPNYQGNIDRICICRNREIDQTVEALKNREVDLSMGSPLEVAKAMESDSGFVRFPNQGLVVTHAILNCSKEIFRTKVNRLFVQSIFEELKSKDNFLSKYDSVLDTFLPKGLMDDIYYNRSINSKVKSDRTPIKSLKIIFPKGIMLRESEKMTIDEFEKYGIVVTPSYLKGREYVDAILKSDFDIVIAPYQGVFPDPDGYLEMLDPKSILKNVDIPVEKLFHLLGESRFLEDKDDRISTYGKAFKSWEDEAYVIPISQNGIPIVFNNRLSIPDMNFGFHLSLRNVSLK